MFARTFICAALVAATATACSSSSPAAKAQATTPAAIAATTTAAPSATAPASATHPAATLDAAAVVAKFKVAGLPVSAVTVYTAATDTNHLLGRPGGYTSKASFVDTRINAADAKNTDSGSVDLGGSVEVYPDAAGAQARSAYIRKALSSMPMLGTEYDYISGAVLLRVSQALTPEQAAGYQKALG